jgi:hypothetical protein
MELLQLEDCNTATVAIEFLQWVGGVIAEERGEEDRNYCNLYLQKHK